MKSFLSLSLLFALVTSTAMANDLAFKCHNQEFEVKTTYNETREIHQLTIYQNQLELTYNCMDTPVVTVDQVTFKCTAMNGIFWTVFVVDTENQTAMISERNVRYLDLICN